jgi:hypothetical protein
MEEIDYSSKIFNFLAMTETNDEEAAMNYLEQNDWDETKAVNKFYSDIDKNQTNNELINESNNINITNRSKVQLINENNINNDININEQNRESFIYKYFVKLPYQFILNCCSENREVSKEDEKKLFRFFPNLVDDFLEFCHLIKKKIGIIIFYSGKNIIFLKTLISYISRSTNNMNIMKQYFVVFPILANTRDSNKIQDLIIDNSDNNIDIILPSFIFCYNRSNNKNSYLNPILNKNHIIYKLEGESTTVDSFYEAIKETSKYIETRNNNLISNSLNSLDKSFGLLTDGEILTHQKYEMEELERKVQLDEEKQKQEEIEQENNKKKEELIEKEIQEKAKEASKKVLEEPNSEDPDSTTICFRYPDGEKSINRRFLKSHRIQNLYDYVESLGEEIYTEKENNKFSLYQPFPPKKYDNMENTLEMENLFPNAVIQIREEE